MMCLFNRRELTVTMDMQRQAEIRNILSKNGIEYRIKTINLLSPNVVGAHRGHVGSFGVNADHSYEYKFYVRKNDYENAKRLIGM